MNLSDLFIRAVLPMRMNGHLVSKQSSVTLLLLLLFTFYLSLRNGGKFAGMNLEEAIGAVVTSISNVIGFSQ